MFMYGSRTFFRRLSSDAKAVSVQQTYCISYASVTENPQMLFVGWQMKLTIHQYKFNSGRCTWCARFPRPSRTSGSLSTPATAPVICCTHARPPPNITAVSTLATSPRPKRIRRVERSLHGICAEKCRTGGTTCSHGRRTNRGAGATARGASESSSWTTPSRPTTTFSPTFETTISTWITSHTVSMSRRDPVGALVPHGTAVVHAE